MKKKKKKSLNMKRSNNNWLIFLIFDLILNCFHTFWLLRPKRMEILVFFLSKSFLVDVAFIFQAAYMKLFIMIKLTNKCFTGYTNIFYYFIEKKVNFLLVDDCNNIIETCLKTISTKLTKKKKKIEVKKHMIFPI